MKGKTVVRTPQSMITWIKRDLGYVRDIVSTFHCPLLKELQIPAHSVDTTHLPTGEPIVTSTSAMLGRTGTTSARLWATSAPFGCTTS